MLVSFGADQITGDLYFTFDLVPLSINMTKHPAPGLCGVARDKAELFRERYTILQQVWIYSVFLRKEVLHAVLYAASEV